MASSPTGLYLSLHLYLDTGWRWNSSRACLTSPAAAHLRRPASQLSSSKDQRAARFCCSLSSVLPQAVISTGHQRRAISWALSCAPLFATCSWSPPQLALSCLKLCLASHMSQSARNRPDRAMFHNVGLPYVSARPSLLPVQCQECLSPGHSLFY